MSAVNLLYAGYRIGNQAPWRGLYVRDQKKGSVTAWFIRLQLPTPDDPIIVATDGNPQYAEALAQLYCESCIEYGQIIKHRNGNRLLGTFRVKIMGNPAIEAISTSIV